MPCRGRQFALRGHSRFPQRHEGRHCQTGPEFAGTKIPAFDEVLNYARGKINIYVDVKQVTAKDLVDHIVGHGMTDHVVIYSGRISKDIHVSGNQLQLRQAFGKPGCRMGACAGGTGAEPASVFAAQSRQTPNRVQTPGLLG